MEIFVAVVEAQQLTRAAQRLHISKSAVSYALTDLERYLDLQLLNRNSRSWQLTDAGQNYYSQCKRILSDIEKMEDNVRQSDSLSGLIRLSAPDTFGSYTLVPVIAKFLEKHPNVEIELNLTERTVDLIEERVDLAFRTGFLKDSSLIAKTIGEAKTMILASPDYVSKYGKPTSHLDLKSHRCIQYSRSPKWRMSKNGRWHEFIPRGPIYTDSGESMREFCIRGSGLAFMPSMLADFAIKKRRLLPVLSDYDFMKMPINALRVGHSRTSMRVLEFLDFIVLELRTRPRDVAEFIKV